MPVASSNNVFLVKAASKALDSIFLKGLQYKKVGVIVAGIVPDNQLQGNLFYEDDRIKQNKVSVATDLLNRKFGRDTIKLAAQGSGKEWKLRQEKLSKGYTTDINDIIQIKS